MISRSAALTVLALVGVPAPRADASDAPVVRVDSGALAGVAEGDVHVFRGIPYAAPPIGALRWRAPQKVRAWEGVRSAVDFGNDCMQKVIPGDAGAGGAPPGEDCLFVNVWRPANAAVGARLPVLVWIHGGGALNGGASAAIFDGSAFARAGVIVVSMNYRLGRLGFFAHPALTAAREGPLGNYAFLDQVAALRWVARNVRAFGGDPEQVTLAGESAGGVSVLRMLVDADVRGLFRGAVVLSGGGRSTIMGGRPMSAGEAAGVAFARSRGIEVDGATALAALRGLTAEQANGDLSMMALLENPATYAGGPLLGGAGLPRLPGEAIAAGKAARVPLVIGTTARDLGVDFPPPDDPYSFFGPDSARARAAYDPTGALGAKGATALIAVDRTMHEPARFVAREFAARGAHAWLYRFDYTPEHLRPGAAGCEHAMELPFLFASLDRRYPAAAVTANDRATARAFHAYVANFVKTGNPNGRDLPAWPRHDPARADRMVFTMDEGPRMLPDPWQERLDLVERAVRRAAGR